MPGTDLAKSPAYLARVQRLYPGAVDVGRVTGTRHLVRAEVRKMEKRGEIVSVQRFAKEIRPGVLEIPYVRLKTRERVRREQAIKLALIGFLGFGAAYVVGWLIWESRYALMTLAGAMLGAAGLFYFSLHWRNGCPGVHCSGCGG